MPECARMCHECAPECAKPSQMFVLLWENDVFWLVCAVPGGLFCGPWGATVYMQASSSAHQNIWFVMEYARNPERAESTKQQQHHGGETACSPCASGIWVGHDVRMCWCVLAFFLARKGLTSEACHPGGESAHQGENQTSGTGHPRCAFG